MTNGKHKARKETGPLRSRIVGEGAEAPDQLLANPLNWRTHPKEQVDALEGLLREVGWVQRVIVNRTTGHIVDGHARIELAMRRSEATVPVLPFDKIDELGAGMYRGERVTRSARAKDQDAGHPPALGGETPTRTLQPLLEA